MTEERDPNELFILELQQLGREGLALWVRQHLTSVSFSPKAPFDSVNDPMDVLERTLNLVNQYAHFPETPTVQFAYEDALVSTFSEELKRRHQNFGMIHKFISLFTNADLQSIARRNLIAILTPVVLNRQFKHVTVGARDVYYDSLQLLTELFNNNVEEFQNFPSVGAFLLQLVEKDPEPRMVNICLLFFRNICDIRSYFTVFEKAFSTLPAEKMDGVIDTLVSFYKNYDGISWAYFANWLMSKHYKTEFSPKLVKLYNHERFYRLVVKQWNENHTADGEPKTESAHFLTAILLLINLSRDPSVVCPEHVSLFFEQTNLPTSKLSLRKILKDESFYDMPFQDFIATLGDNPELDYYKFHLFVLVDVISFANGDISDLRIENRRPQEDIQSNLYIDFDTGTLHIVIENLKLAGTQPNFVWPSETNGMVEIYLEQFSLIGRCWELLENVIPFDQVLK
ncbi:hypothetical protein ACFGVS_00705 [Mucilaginibacter sp. AW1-7]|uniref:hypothetical protein n=1 Tax=Mucilaginibacter sp. AW1-7 TaxID=3349874 RepID=UPI003F7371B2